MKNHVKAEKFSTEAVCYFIFMHALADKSQRVRVFFLFLNFWSTKTDKLVDNHAKVAQDAMVHLRVKKYMGNYYFFFPNYIIFNLVPQEFFYLYRLCFKSFTKIYLIVLRTSISLIGFKSCSFPFLESLYIYPSILCKFSYLSSSFM